MFAFFGMESALQVNGGSLTPRGQCRERLAPLLGVALLYISVQLVAQGVLGDALSAPGDGEGASSLPRSSSQARLVQG